METLVHSGGEVKALGGGKFRAPLVIFGREAKDLDGDFFTESTDLWQDFSEPVYVPFLYAHGLDPELKHAKLGDGKVSLSRDDAGVWMEGQLKISDAYQAKIYEMIEAGKIGTSSGSIAHLVSRRAEGKAFELKSWPIAEASLTPKPCNPMNKVQAVKDFQSLDIPEFKDVMATTAGYAPPNNREPAPLPPPFQTATGSQNDKNDAPAVRDSGSVECPACHLHCHFDAGHKECPYCGQTLSLSAEGTPLVNPPDGMAGKSLNLTFGEELNSALAAVESCTKRAEGLRQIRVKSDRTLSAATRQKIQDVSEALAKLLASIKPEDLDALNAMARVVDITVIEAQMAVWEAEQSARDAELQAVLMDALSDAS